MHEVMHDQFNYFWKNLTFIYLNDSGSDGYDALNFLWLKRRLFDIYDWIFTFDASFLIIGWNLVLKFLEIQFH